MLESTGVQSTEAVVRVDIRSIHTYFYLNIF